MRSETIFFIFLTKQNNLKAFFKMYRTVICKFGTSLDVRIFKLGYIGDIGQICVQPIYIYEKDLICKSSILPGLDWVL